MRRRRFLRLSAAASGAAATAGCLDVIGSAEIAVVGGSVDRVGDRFDITLELERVGSAGRYRVSVLIEDDGDNAVRRRIGGEVDADTDRWTDTGSVRLSDADGADEMGASYDATARVVRNGEVGGPVELRTE